ncbi:MAG: hypothetical protein WCB94_07160 [Terriglobales bacterium]
MSDDLDKRLDEIANEISSIKSSVERRFRNLSGYTAQTEARLQAAIERLAAKQEVLLAAIEELRPGLIQGIEAKHKSEESQLADEATVRGRDIAETLLNQNKFRP